ncbi:MAG TPA: TonB family protein [Rhizomicrobium sp.]|nr:TonB family protein [Rhizomicrobium sp.]
MWGLFAGLLQKTSAPAAVVVHVSLLPNKQIPAKLTPLPLPPFSRPPEIVSITPRFAVVQPPPPDAIRAAPKPPAPPVTNPQPAPFQTQPLPADYLSRLVAHLNAYKIYPYEARIRREQGTVRLRFSIDRSGHVLSYDVVDSSGSASLDAESRTMIQRADPFPPAPANFPGSKIDLVVPLVFSLH